jgi:superfamily II DNA or RNA helicase
MSDSGTGMTGSSSSPVSTSSRRTIIPAISSLKFPFNLTKDQTEAVEAWMTNGCRGSIIYSTGTGKTEIAFQCAKRAYELIKQKGKSTTSCPADDSPFNILFLVPRIILVQQNINRLTRYGILKESIGAYFGERKEVREITIITYQSAANNVQLIHNSNMIIFDEVHLVSDTATTLRKIFDFVNAADPKKPLLGLTATIDEQDPRYNSILSLLPPVRRYMINDAVKDRRLARPIIIPIKADLTYDEQKMCDEYSSKIRNISRYLNTSDPKLISSHLKRGGHSARLARAWFMNVKNRKSLLNFAQNKLVAATELIIKKHPSERIMVFSETIESIQKLQEMLRNKGTRSEIIHAALRSKQRQKILSEWGKEFFALLSVHTLEIGYDVPDVRAAIILASTSNMNQIVQRIGRAIRKTEGKDTALIYTIYLSQTHDTNTLKMVRQATDVDAKNNEKKKPANNRILSSGNMSLDRYIV